MSAHRIKKNEGRGKRPPAMGERAALSGYVPQYEVAAGLVLRALTRESLEWLALLDPKAGRLDDFQLGTLGRLDAYQIKWSQSGGQLAWRKLASYLVQMVADRRKLADQHPDWSVVGHLHTNLVASSSSISGAPQDHVGASVANAVAQLLWPATEGAFASIENLPDEWRWLWRTLADCCDLTEGELLSDFPHIRIELGQSLPSQAELAGRDALTYRRNLDELMLVLLRIATDPRKPVRLTKGELLARLGDPWQKRLEVVSVHEFPLPLVYQPVKATTQHLTKALDTFTNGYVALIGSPGSGKSTLLTQELRGHQDLVAHYYAYVTGRADPGSTRSEASTFLHDLVLTLERSGLQRGPAPLEFDVLALSTRLSQKMEQLGQRYQKEGRRAIIMVDGLDHVERECDVERSMLRYLPRPEGLPAGVLFVLGSQTVRMLHSDIRAQLKEPGRTIEMVGLERLAVAQIANEWAVTVDADRLWKVSGGHPLILTYLLQELQSLPSEQQEIRLAVIPDFGGDVEKLYQRLWASIENDEELIALLALTCRMRGAVDFSWLRERGQPDAVVHRLREQLSHLFRREPDRWRFFHESFRLFLRDRTARVAGEPEPAEDRRFHLKLAQMCRTTPVGDSQSWEMLFHLACAEEHAAVLETATPDFFRAQQAAQRPAELVAADIRLAARSLSAVQDPRALVRLVIGAGEVSQRRFHFPDQEKYLSLLVHTGQGRKAVEYMEVDRDNFGAEDARIVRLRISLLLRDKGLHQEGFQAFEVSEPLEVLRGRADWSRLRSPYKLLGAWARAAAVFRGSDTVLSAAKELQIARHRPVPGRDEEDPTPLARTRMLATAADELQARDQLEQSDRVLTVLDLRQVEDRKAWVWALASRWARKEERTSELVSLIDSRLIPQDLGVAERVTVAEALWKTGQPDGAQRWIDGLPQPPISSDFSHDLWAEERHRYRLNRLLTALGHEVAAQTVVPAASRDWEWGFVYVARISVAIAGLHGNVWAEKLLTADEFMAVVKHVFRILESGSHELSLSHTLGEVRPKALAQLLSVAALHGREIVKQVWQEYVRRWDENPIRLRQDGHVVLPVALDTGLILRSTVLKHLRKLEDLVRATAKGGEAAGDFTDLAETMYKCDLPDDTRRLLKQAVGATLAVSHRKDYQLSDWIDLLGPRLDGQEGARLVRWLAGTITDLREYATGKQANDAARRLLLADSARRPGHGWQVGAWLQERDVVDWDDRLLALLEAQIKEAANELWWIILNEHYLPLASESPEGLVETASRIAAGARGLRWLRRRLRTLAERLEVEAPPQTREAWRIAAADAAVECGIALPDLGLSGELHRDRRPPRTRARGTDEQKRDAFLSAHSTVQSLLAGASRSTSTEFHSEWEEAVDLVASRMDLKQLEQAVAIFSLAVSDRLNILVRLAQRALDLQAPDLAGKLAENVIARATPSSWLPTWDGGPLLKAFRLMAEIDYPRARDRAYRRFAIDAASDPYLLSQVCQNLDGFLTLFGVDDREALGQEVEKYLHVLLDDPGAQPPSDVLASAEDGPTTLARTGFDLLDLPYRLAVTTAQRVIVACLQARDARVESLLIRALEGKDEEVMLRTLSVMESALDVGASLRSVVTDALIRWTTAEHLGVRMASRRLSERLGRTLDPPPARQLPSVYSLVVPPSPRSFASTEEIIARDDLEVSAIRGETLLRVLAEACGIQLEILNARVSLLARSLAGEGPIDDRRWQTDSSSLGWSFYKRSTILWERAAARVASELVDAGRIHADWALRLSTGPGYDSALIAARPGVRPNAIVMLSKAASEGTSQSERWLNGLKDSEGRLARSLPGAWTVIGEHTELRILDPKMPWELRKQSLGVLTLLPQERAPQWLNGRRLVDLEEMRNTVGATPLVYHWDPSFRGPSAWLTLHPQLAEACGWVRDQKKLIGWRDHEGPVIWSFWWRSGWLDSTTSFSFGPVEVGEGWLVLARPRGLQRLAQLLGGQLGVAWQVERGFLEKGTSSDKRSGRLAL